MIRLKKLRALSDGTISRLLKRRDMDQAELDAAIDEHYSEGGIGMDFSAFIKAATAIKEAFKTFAVSMGKAAVAISFLVAAFEAIEQ